MGSEPDRESVIGHLLGHGAAARSCYDTSVVFGAVRDLSLPDELSATLLLTPLFGAVIAGDRRPLPGDRSMSRRRSGSSSTKTRRRHQRVTARPLPFGRTPSGRLSATESPDAEREPEAVVVTHWFDSGTEGEPYDATVRLTGRRVGVSGMPKAGDSFSRDETIEGVIPGTGPVSLTAWVYGLTPGEWTVDARLIRRPSPSGTRHRIPSISPQPVERAAWSWHRWSVSSVPARPIRTRWALLAPLARQPAVIPGVYAALAVIGFIVALSLQAAVLTRAGAAVGPPFAASVAALVAGLVGAKTWYKVLHPEESWLTGGWAVDGFLVVAPIIAAVILFVARLPVGRVLDATTPGIFFAVVLGRVGCFLTGCCAGRCTASRWGIWSSDRRIGARRVPTQLLESLAGLALGLLSLAVVVAGGLLAPGLVFVATFAVYALIRQGLLRIRSERRRVSRTLPATAAAAVLVVVVIAVLALAQGL